MAIVRDEATNPMVNQDRVTPAGAAFDALEITAVGDAIGAKSEIEGQGSGPMRVPRLTPRAGGLAARLAQTRTEIGKPDGRDRMTPVVVSREQSSPTAALDAPEITAVDSTSGDEKSRSGIVAAPIEQGSVASTTHEQGLVASTTDAQGSVASTADEQGSVASTFEAPQTPAPVLSSGPTPVTKEPGQESNEVRPKRLTPGSGGLAALLEERRSRIGKQVQSAPSSPGDRATPLVATAAAMTDPHGGALRQTGSGVPEAIESEPQQKNPGFSSTLQGVSGPVIDFGSRVTPLVGGEAERTDGNTAPAGDTSEATYGERLSLDHQSRSTEAVDAPKSRRRPRIMMGVGAVVVVAVVAFVLFVPKNRGKGGGGSPVTPVETVAATPGAASPSGLQPSELQPAVPGTTAAGAVAGEQQPSGTREPVVPPQAGAVAPAPVAPATGGQVPVATAPVANAEVPAATAPTAAVVAPPAPVPTTTAPAAEVSPAPGIAPATEGRVAGAVVPPSVVAAPAAEIPAAGRDEGAAVIEPKLVEPDAKTRSIKSRSKRETAGVGVGSSDESPRRVVSRSSDSGKAASKSRRKGARLPVDESAADAFVTVGRGKGRSISEAPAPLDDPDAVLPLSRH